MPHKPNQRKQYIAHYNRIERYASLLEGIYKQSIDEFVKLALSANHDPTKAFRWASYPQTKRSVDKLLRGLSNNVQSVVVNGVTAEWGESNFKNDRLAHSIIGIKQFEKDDKGGDKIPARFKPYFNNNADALQSFIGRKHKGLNLSQKVWKLTEQYKSDLEIALTAGLSDGRSAAELSRDIRTYLKEPAKLFRRVRSENGSLQLSKAAKAYHPGVGTYRSSYKNAMRLTRTEINIAYRTADSVRYGQLDFVVGFEVKRSGRGYDCSVCQSLAGKYPKDFKFTGWHPHCRCYVIPILKTDEEFWAWDGRGEAPTASANEVMDVPSGYKDWMGKNSQRIDDATKKGTLPYFLRDNKKYADIRTPSISHLQTATKDSKHLFTDVKALSEAQEYAQTFTEKYGLDRIFKGEVDYSGISIENANEINRALTEVFNSIDAPKISGIRTVSPTSARGKKIFQSGSDAIAAYSPVERGIFLNKDILKSGKSFADYKQKATEAWDKVMSNIDKLPVSQREIALRYKEAGRALFDDSLKGCITHELGHHVQWSMLKAELNNELGKRMSLYSGKISGYASTSKSEYLAESFSAYMRREFRMLDPKYIEFLGLSKKQQYR